MRWKYTKLLMNLANSIEATVTPDPDVKELVRRVRTEGETTLRAAGIDFASRDEDKERRGDRMQVQPVDGQMRGGGSSWQSLARGTRSTDYLNGEIVTLGRLHGVPTPANALMQRVANEQARAGAPPQSVPVAGMLAELT
jgi:2-dehydropantoate 2-reductase